MNAGQAWPPRLPLCESDDDEQGQDQGRAAVAREAHRVGWWASLLGVSLGGVCGAYFGADLGHGLAGTVFGFSTTVGLIGTIYALVELQTLRHRLDKLEALLSKLDPLHSIA